MGLFFVVVVVVAAAAAAVFPGRTVAHFSVRKVSAFGEVNMTLYV